MTDLDLFNLILDKLIVANHLVVDRDYHSSYVVIRDSKLNIIGDMNPEGFNLNYNLFTLMNIISKAVDFS